MKYIEKKSVVELPPASNYILDIINITDKIINAYKIKLTMKFKLNTYLHFLIY